MRLEIEKAINHNNDMQRLDNIRSKVVFMLDKYKLKNISINVRNMIAENVSLYPNTAEKIISSFDSVKPIPENKKRLIKKALMTEIYYVNDFGQAFKY